MAPRDAAGQDPPDLPQAPQYGGKKPFLLRLPPELMEDLRGWATQDLRSLNAHIEFLLREAVKRRKSGKG
jgi:hypothetical protein